MATIPINLIVCLLFGLALTACARTQLLSGASPFRRELGLVLCFALLSVAPTATYFYLTYRDWSWMYLVDPARMPGGTGLAVVVVEVMLVPLGFLLGWLLLRLRPRVLAERGLFSVIGALTTALVFVIIVWRQRLLAFGRYDDFHSARLLLRPISQSKLLFALLACLPLLLASGVIVGVALWRYGRWLRQQAFTTAQRSAIPLPELPDGIDRTSREGTNRS